MGGCDVAEAERSRNPRRVLLRRSCGICDERQLKLALFEKLKARGGFALEDRAKLLKVERVLRRCRSCWYGKGKRWRSDGCSGLNGSGVRLAPRRHLVVLRGKSGQGVPYPGKKPDNIPTEPPRSAYPPGASRA
jgi:hypothetical protein